MSWNNTVEQGVNSGRLDVSPEHARLLEQIRVGMNWTARVTSPAVTLAAAGVAYPIWTSDVVPRGSILTTLVHVLGSNADLSKWGYLKYHALVGRTATGDPTLLPGSVTLEVSDSVAPPVLTVGATFAPSSSTDYGKFTLTATPGYPAVKCSFWLESFILRL